MTTVGVAMWELRHNDELLGTLTALKDEFPWIVCTFDATPMFELQFRALFDEEWWLPPADFTMEDWVRWVQKIDSLHLQLLPTGGDAKSVRRFVLHITHSRAWFRCLLD